MQIAAPSSCCLSSFGSFSNCFSANSGTAQSSGLRAARFSIRPGAVIGKESHIAASHDLTMLLVEEEAHDSQKIGGCNF